MSMYRLSPFVRHCAVDDGVVILNLKTQKYLSLPCEWRETFERIIDGRSTLDSRRGEAADTTPAAALKGLLDADLVFLADGPATPASPVHMPPRNSLTALPYERPKSTVWLRYGSAFVASLSTAGYQLKFKTFEDVIQHIQGARTRIATNAEEDGFKVSELFQAFRWLRLWSYSASGACLFDSLALVDFLTRNNVVARLTLGVRSKPFGAHAWVQWHDVALNDSVENVTRYTPILVC
jgi:hypothetical protein